MTRTPAFVTPDGAALDEAAALLARGEVVAIPTDTVYGVAVSPVVPGATDRLFAAKGRSRDVPIAVLVADAAQAWSIARRPPPSAALRLAARHWPGPLTIVVERSPDWSADLGDDRMTVGVRCPDDDWVRALCQRTGALATSSANRHGEPTPPDAVGVAGVFAGAVALVVDGGRRHGLPSTVVRCGHDGAVEVVRSGAIAPEALTE